MGEFYKKIVGLTLVLIVSFSSYLMLVQIVNGVTSEKLLTFFKVTGMRKTDSASKFTINDVLVAQVGCRRGSSYDLQFYSNSSLIFEKRGEMRGSMFNISVPIVPPVFNAGKTYVAAFHVYSYNNPIPGAFHSDSDSYAFEVGKVGTRLDLSGGYCGSIRNAFLRANLTDVDGYPVADERVDFGMRFNPTHRVTDSWYSVGAALTNASGMAETSLGLGVPDGNYSVRIYHADNENFGESEDTMEIRVSPDQDFDFGQQALLKTYERCEALFSGNGTLNIFGETSAPYADLPVNVTSRYTTDTPIDTNYGLPFVVLYLDYMNISGFITAKVLSLVNASSSYVYETSTTWIPGCIGQHKLIGGVVIGDIIHDLQEAIVNGTGIIASDNSTVQISRCPSSAVILAPSAVFGDTLPVTVAFSAPRRDAYEPKNLTGFSSCVLGFELSYLNRKYIIDRPVGSVPIELRVNSTFAGTAQTNSSGLACITAEAGSVSGNSTLSLNIVVNESSLIYGGANFTKCVNMTRVNVLDAVSGKTNIFKLNCTVLNNAGEEGSIYVGAENSVETTALVSELPVENVPLSVLIGKPLNRTCTNSTCPPWASIYSNPTCLRVTRVYNITNIPPYDAIFPAADVNYDGKIDVRDNYIVTRAYGTWPGYANWNWRADINFDLKVDAKDVFYASHDYGKWIQYKSVANLTDVQVVFRDEYNQSSEVWLDKWGCTSVPSGAKTLKLRYQGEDAGGVFEFFNCSYHAECSTNNVGVGKATWVPPESGENYFMHVQVPENFAVLAQKWVNETAVNAEVSLVRFLNVIKKPVSVTIDGLTDFQIKTIEAEADTYVSTQNPNTNYGNEPFLLAGATQYQWGHWYKYNAYVRFNISSIPQDAYILSASIGLYLDHPGGNAVYRGFDIYRVESAWNEPNITWNNQPGCAVNESYHLVLTSYMYDTWSQFNVTEDVRMWHNGSATNFGHVLKIDDEREATTYWCSRENEQCDLRPVLFVSYIPSSSNVTVYDSVSNHPVPALQIGFYVDNVNIENHTTSSEGKAAINWKPMLNHLYNVSAQFLGNETYLPGNTSKLCDFRYPTNITSRDGNWINVSAGFQHSYFFSLTSLPIFNFDGNLRYFINGTYADGTLYNSSDWMYGFEDGWHRFDWAAPSNGTFSMRIVYEGSSDFLSCEVCVLVTAVVTPLVVSFGVSSNAFEPNSNVGLSATILYASTNAPFTGYSVKVEFFNFSSDGSVSSYQVYSNDNGYASVNLPYPDDGKAHAFSAKIVSGLVGNNVQPQGTICTPIQLTVSKSTRLLLNVSRSASSSEHVIEGWLKWNTTGVSNRQVKLKVNETEFWRTTDANGYFRLNRNLQPVNNERTTYMISASFEDNTTQPLNATAWATTIDGQRYAACTTTQYGYKPAFNTTILTVEPQSTESTVSTKTPEEMQEEAKQKGLWSTYDEWVWGLLYRYHVKITLNGSTIDIGFTPMLPICGVLESRILHDFIPPIPITTEHPEKIIMDYFVGTAVDVFGFAGTAVACCLSQVPGIAGVGLLAYGAGLGLPIAYAWSHYNSGERMEAFATLAGFVIDCFGAGITGLIGLLAHETVTTFSNAIAFPILGAALSNMLNPGEIISTVMNIIAISCTAFAIGYIINHYIPNPQNCYFEPLFIAESFAFAAIAIDLLYSWAGWW